MGVLLSRFFTESTEIWEFYWADFVRKAQKYGSFIEQILYGKHRNMGVLLSRFCTESTEIWEFYWADFVRKAQKYGSFIEQNLYGKHRKLSAFFLFAIFGVQEILNRIFHKDLRGAKLHEGFVLLSLFSG